MMTPPCTSHASTVGRQGACRVGSGQAGQGKAGVGGWWVAVHLLPAEKITPDALPPLQARKGGTRCWASGASTRYIQGARPAAASACTRRDQHGSRVSQGDY